MKTAAQVEERPAMRRGTGHRTPIASWIALPAIAAGIFVFYFLPYSIRHLRFPMGFDTPWYVLHARSIAVHGIGHGPAAFKLGYPLLSTVLGTVTGRTPLEMASVLPLLLLSVLALAVGAFARVGLGMDRAGCVIVTLVTAALLGPTDLAGENLAALLTAIFAVVALLLVARSRIGPGRWGAIAFLVAGGLAHWDFLLAMIDGVLLVAVLLSFRRSRTEWRAGTALLRTEAGRIALIGAAATAITLGLVVWVFRAPLVTIELAQSSRMWLYKFLGKLALLGPGAAGLFAVAVLDACLPRSADLRTDRAAARRSVRAWAYAMGAGLLVGLATLKVPPSRFLDLLVAFPGGVAVGAAAALLGREMPARLPSRWSARARRGGAAVAVGAAVLLLSVPGVIRWYPYATWLRTDTFAQAGAADRYMATLDPHQPVVFVLAYRPEFAQAVAAEERNIRLGLSPGHETNAYFFVGDLADLLAGRRSAPPDRWSDDVTRPYWEAVRDVLPQKPPVFILESLSKARFGQAARVGGQEFAPGVMILQSPRPPSPLSLGPVPDAVARLPVALGWAMALLGLLVLAGVGWSRALLGAGTRGEAILGLAPAFGGAALILSALVLDQLGLRLGGGGGIAAFMLATLSGGAVAAWKLKRPGDQRSGRTEEHHLRRKITPSSSR